MRILLLLTLLLAGCSATVPQPQADPRDPAVIRNMPRANYPTPR